MLRTLTPLLDRLQQASSDDGRHNAVMDLVESLLRHVAVVAIAVYQQSGTRDRGVDRLLSTRLHWPSMGSWAGFVRAITALGEDKLPDGFHSGFLAPLKRKSGNEAVGRAGRAAQAIVDAASSRDGVQLSGGSGRYSALDFFDLMVRYRNATDGHGFHSLSQEQQAALGDLGAGVKALCHELRPIWLAFPLYVAVQTSSAGASFHRLVPLVKDPGIAELESQGEGLMADRLYVLLDRKFKEFASLYPIALWHGDDALFLNGSQNFAEIKYLGFASQEHLQTDKHEKAFCNFVLPFMGGENLSVTDLSDARVKAQAETLKAGGWVFPQLKVGSEVGPEGARYRLTRRLGRGGMAEVWAARSLSGKRDVALKFLLNPDHAPRFRREARALKAFSGASKRIVGYLGDHYDPHPARRLFFLVMELLSGETLADRAKAEDPLDWNEVVTWMADAAEGLKTIHGAGGIHRDIKPANLMLGRDGRVRLGDLGLVGEAEGAESALLTSVGLTRAGEAIGTYEFCAEEQLRAGIDGARADARSDLFSLGATFYYLVTNELPFGSGNLVRILEAHRSARLSGGGPTPVADLRADCPTMLAELITALVQVAPDRRPATAERVLEAIAQIRKDMRGEKVNANLNLMGRLGEDGVAFRDLMPAWCSTYIFKVWLAVMVLQYLLVMPLSRAHKTWTSIDGLGPGWETHAFWQDYMFLVWNTIPFVLIGLLYRSRKRVQALMQSVWRLDLHRTGGHWEASARRNDKWAWFINSRLLKGILIFVGAGAIVPQVTKLWKFAQTQEAYWWSWHVDPASYIVRAITLFFDMIGIVLVLVVVTAMVDIISHVLKGARLQVDLHHSDRAGGLSDVGRLVGLYIPFVAVVAANTVVGTVDHRGQDPMQVAFDWIILVVLAGLSGFLVMWPMLPVRRQFKRYQRTEIERLSGARRAVEAQMQGLIDGGRLAVDQANEHTALGKVVTDLRAGEREVARLKLWPMGRSTAVLLILLGLLPLPLALVLRFLV